MTAGRILTLVAMAALLGGVASCGRKAGLDTPYEAGIDARKEAQKAGEPLPPEPEPPVADKPFILDRLIK